MASASVPEIHSWGNPYHLSLPGTRRPSPLHGRGLKVPFFFSCGVAGRADHRRWRACTSPFFQRLVQRDIPCRPRFLVRPRLLTRCSSLPCGGPFSLLSLIGCWESWGFGRLCWQSPHVQKSPPHRYGRQYHKNHDGGRCS